MTRSTSSAPLVLVPAAVVMMLAGYAMFPPAPGTTVVAAQAPAAQPPAGTQPAGGRGRGRGPLPEGYVPMTQPTPAAQAGTRSQELEANGRVLRVTFRTGDEVMAGLAQFAIDNKITSAYITGLGGFDAASFGWYDLQVGGFKKLDLPEKVEVNSVIGNYTPGQNGATSVHLHALVSGPDGTVKGGHLISARVNPVLDLYIVETPPVALPAPPAGR